MSNITSNSPRSSKRLWKVLLRAQEPQTAQKLARRQAELLQQRGMTPRQGRK
jgi:hypothetical protein